MQAGLAMVPRNFNGGMRTRVHGRQPVRRCRSVDLTHVKDAEDEQTDTCSLKQEWLLHSNTRGRNYE